MENSEDIEISLDKSLNDKLLFNMYAGDTVKKLVRDAPSKIFSEFIKSYWLLNFNMLLIASNIAASENRVSEKLKILSNKLVTKREKILENIKNYIEENNQNIDVFYTFEITGFLLKPGCDLNIDETNF